MIGSLMPLGGCAVHEARRSEPGIDVSSVKPGATRAEIEAVVGAAERDWTTRLGVRYRLYRYYGGTQPVSAGDTSVLIFFEVVSLGLFEVLRVMDPSLNDITQGAKQYLFMAVSYDASDVAIGVFPGIDQFAALPADGRPPSQAPAAPPGDGPATR